MKGNLCAKRTRSSSCCTWKYQRSKVGFRYFKLDEAKRRVEQHEGRPYVEKVLAAYRG